MDSVPTGTTSVQSGTIAQRMTRVSQPPVTYLGEISAANLAATAQTSPGKRKTPARDSESSLDEEEEEEDQVEHDLGVAAKRVDFIPEDLDPRAEVLPQFKVKATKESISVPEISKLVAFKDLAGDTPYGPLCENLFTMISCLVMERVITGGLTLTDDEKLALYGQYYYEQCHACSLDTYLCEYLFEYIPDQFQRDIDGGLIWPGFYLDYIKEKYADKKITGTQENRTRSLKKLTLEEGKRYNFSVAIKNAATTAKTEINNR